MTDRRPRETHDAGTKAAVMAALLTGQSVGATARAYKIPQQTVSDWNAQAKALLTDGKRSEKEKIDIGDRLGTYLRASLDALVVHVEHTKDPAWLRQQDASSLAVLHGVMVDKVVRILEAAEAAHEQQSAAEAEGEEAAG